MRQRICLWAAWRGPLLLYRSADGYKLRDKWRQTGHDSFPNDREIEREITVAKPGAPRPRPAREIFVVNRQVLPDLLGSRAILQG